LDRPGLLRPSDRVWATPETCYGETAAAAAHKDELTTQGFEVTEILAGIPTALMGRASTIGQMIAFIGEYDDLAGLSQFADLAAETPIQAGGNDHGFGHNMLGPAAMLAATALKTWLAEIGTPDEVRYYGCLAEEAALPKPSWCATAPSKTWISPSLGTRTRSLR